MLVPFTKQLVAFSRKFIKDTEEMSIYLAKYLDMPNDKIYEKIHGKRLSEIKIKTGVTKAHMEQLEIYAALFCLEYKKKPGEIDIELRIYQNNEIIIHHPTADDILPIMDKIITFDKIIEKLKMEGE